MVPIAGPPDYDESPIYKEMLKFHLEETDSLVANIDDMACLIIHNWGYKDWACPAYIMYHRQYKSAWDAKAVTTQTPSDIKSSLPINFATAVSTCAASTFGIEASDPMRGPPPPICGLPTCSRLVSEFMMGLEKTMAKAGEASCAYLFVFLMVLRIDETMSLMFESINIIPGETQAHHYAGEYLDVMLGTHKSTQTVGKQGTVLETEPMSTSQFVCALTVDLQALGYSYWVMYGTHSFRCGSCQYRVKHKAWTVAMVAAWGGWSRLRL
ncbi:hypothetical protein FIBSPDRAFT_884262 [Athelia psychrophila]|uniref:Uncharacterized protein n=1 Tax=Athelia psychrophila TaxID=1759441 RepID=A0A166T8U9_9AGAM|nr:hypothetical protein FIBSPDRAFT_884262 [Fibularhizoctonia sp. CBS 109695]